MPKRNRGKGKKIDLSDLWTLEKDDRITNYESNTQVQSCVSPTLLTAIQDQTLPELKFYFIHVNWFYQRVYEGNISRIEEYLPAEFAVVEFSLKHGIENLYHEIINEKADKGYKREALQTSQYTHKIPLEFINGQSSYCDMYKKLKSFLKPEQNEMRFPPLYASNVVINAVPSLLNKMLRAADENEDQFYVYSLESMFSKLLETQLQSNDISNLNDTVAKILGANKFEHVKGMECAFHREIDGRAIYCSMFIVKSWVFTICDNCCKTYGINMSVDTHYPSTSHGHCISQNTTMKGKPFKELDHVIDVLSMTNVSEQYRIKSSEKTRAEKQRNVVESERLEIIDHSKMQKNVPSNPVPEKSKSSHSSHTLSYASISTNSNAPNFDANSDFPAIGERHSRGGCGKKRNKH